MADHSDRERTELGDAAVRTAGIAIAPAVDAARERTRGGVYTLAAYVLWGFLPVYFLALAPTGPWELVAWRILLSLLFCALVLTVTGTWSTFREIWAHPRTVWWTVGAGALIYVNWQVFVLAALSGQVIETSLGYFINPLVTVGLGVLVLRERLRTTQWVSLGIAAAALTVIVIGYGRMPWIALTLAMSFGFYGLVKKRIGPRVGAVSGLTFESLWLAPAAVVQLIVVAVTSGLTLGTEGAAHSALLLGAGAATAIPLLFFSAGARRIPLTVVGMMQFIAPMMQFAFGVWVLGEPMPWERWAGFALVWLALVVLTVDSLIAARRLRGRRG